LLEGEMSLKTRRKYDARANAPSGWEQANYILLFGRSEWSYKKEARERKRKREI